MKNIYTSKYMNVNVDGKSSEELGRGSGPPRLKAAYLSYSIHDVSCVD